MVIAVVGPTGIGKTRTAAELASRLGADVVVADSRQVYRELEIATNKPSPEERGLARFRMIDVADPRTEFNVQQYRAMAEQEIANVHASGRPVVLEGGSMLWLDALLKGYDLAGVPPDPGRRCELEAMAPEARLELLDRLDPAAGIDRSNPIRVIRAIEILEALGPPLARHRGRRPTGWRIRCYGLAGSRERIVDRLRRRCIEQVRRGLVAETRRALAAGVPRRAPVLSGIGYAEALAYIDGEIDEAELVERMLISNRRYARRQLTWFRRDPTVRWFDADDRPLDRITTDLEGDPP